MSEPDALLRDAARWIIEHELAGHVSPAEVAEGIEEALKRLYAIMDTVIGRAGIQALMARAIHTTTPNARWLETTEIVMDTTVVLKGLTEAIERDGADEVVAGATALVEAVLRLLGAFIGDALALRLVRRGWTDFPQRAAGRGSEEA